MEGKHPQTDIWYLEGNRPRENWILWKKHTSFVLKVWDQKINWWWDWWHRNKDDNELWSLLWKSYDAESYPLTIWSIIRVCFSKVNFKITTEGSSYWICARRKDTLVKTSSIPYYPSLLWLQKFTWAEIKNCNVMFAHMLPW